MNGWLFLISFPSPSMLVTWKRKREWQCWKFGNAVAVSQQHSCLKVIGCADANGILYQLPSIKTLIFHYGLVAMADDSTSKTRRLFLCYLALVAAQKHDVDISNIFTHRPKVDPLDSFLINPFFNLSGSIQFCRFINDSISVIEKSHQFHPWKRTHPLISSLFRN